MGPAGPRAPTRLAPPGPGRSCTHLGAGAAHTETARLQGGLLTPDSTGADERRSPAGSGSALPKPPARAGTPPTYGDGDVIAPVLGLRHRHARAPRSLRSEKGPGALGEAGSWSARGTRRAGFHQPGVFDFKSRGLSTFDPSFSLSFSLSLTFSRGERGKP